MKDHRELHHIYTHKTYTHIFPYSGLQISLLNDVYQYFPALLLQQNKKKKKLVMGVEYWTQRTGLKWAVCLLWKHRWREG